jgi:hypothetical protein
MWALLELQGCPICVPVRPQCESDLFVKGARTVRENQWMDGNLPTLERSGFGQGVTLCIVLDEENRYATSSANEVIVPDRQSSRWIFDVPVQAVVGIVGAEVAGSDGVDQKASWFADFRNGNHGFTSGRFGTGGDVPTFSGEGSSQTESFNGAIHTGS